MARMTGTGSQMRVKSRSASNAAVELPRSNQSHMGRGLQDYEKMLSCARHLPRQATVAVAVATGTPRLSTT